MNYEEFKVFEELGFTYEEKRADILFVIDASGSMKPCFDQLIAHIQKFVAPFIEKQFESLRLGLLAYNVVKDLDSNKWVYRHIFLTGDNLENVKILYGEDEAPKSSLFTRSEGGSVDIATFCESLKGIKCEGDENTPLALDCALDFPFEPQCSTRRVILLFTDEKMGSEKEGGTGIKDDRVKWNEDTAKKMVRKLSLRHIKLYYYGPVFKHADTLKTGSDVITRYIGGGRDDSSPTNSAEDIWSQMNFGDALQKLGETISGDACQCAVDPSFDKAIFKQDTWLLEDRSESKNLGKDEFLRLDVSKPLEWINARLVWTTDVDLDLHAFVLFKDSECGGKWHVSYANKRTEQKDIWLDYDSGVSGVYSFQPEGTEAPYDRPHNRENIRLEKSVLGKVRRVLFATKIYSADGCFSDYNGRVEITTSNHPDPHKPEVYVEMKSSEPNYKWCVIAFLDMEDPEGPTFYYGNKVFVGEPDVDDRDWTAILKKKGHESRS